MKTLTDPTELDYKGMAEGCAYSVEDYEYRVQHALNVMSRNRCPLYMADNELYSEMWEVADIYCEENDIDRDAVDIEEVLFTC